MISKEIDKIIIVVKVGQTDKKAFENTINSLKNVNSPIEWWFQTQLITKIVMDHIIIISTIITMHLIAKKLNIVPNMSVKIIK